jgi:hypothetical protein
MRVLLSEQKLCVTGKFKDFPNKSAMERAIHDAGGATTPSLNAATTGLIVGAGSLSVAERGAMRGLVLLSEDELALLLTQGFIEITGAEQPEQAPRDALIGELRAQLGAPSSEAWSEIIALVDRCPADQLGELVDYITPQLDRWIMSVDVRWVPTTEDVAERREWLAAMPLGELRVAPLSWLMNMLQGVDSPKYRLVRAIHLTDLGVKNADAIKLLGCASLTNLRYLDLGARNTYAQNMWKTLRLAPSTKTLERLCIHEVRDAHVKALDGEHHLHSLRAINIKYFEHLFDDAALRALCCTSWASTITALKIIDRHEPLIILSDDPALLPCLTRIELEDSSSSLSSLPQLMSSLRPCHTLALCCRTFMPSELSLRTLCALTPDVSTSLDISQLTIKEDPQNPKRTQRAHQCLAEYLLQYLPGSPLLKKIPQIKLGRWWTKELADAIAARGGVATR